MLKAHYLALVATLGLAAPATAASSVDPEVAADISIDQVRDAVAKATPEAPADFSGKSSRTSICRG